MIRTLDETAVREATPWPALMEAIAEILATESAEAPQRHIHPVPTPGGGIGSLLLMPAWISGELIGVKSVTYFGSNAGTDISTVNSTYLAFDGRSGVPIAVLDGDELTARRTAAISALAASQLARPDARKLLVVGTGALSPNMARAHSETRSLTEIAIWGRRPPAASAVAQVLAAEGLPARQVDDLDAAVRQADIISCVTGATEPLIRGELLEPGTHVDLVGSFRPDMRESDDVAVQRARVFVDTVEGATQAGDLAQPLEAGAISRDQIVADLRALATGRHVGRGSQSEITLFKSAGFALADMAAARLALAGN